MHDEEPIKQSASEGTPSSEAAEAANADTGNAETTRFPGQQTLFDTEDRPLFQDREESSPAPRQVANADGETDPAPPIQDTDRNDVLATIREVFARGGPRDRDTAIRDVAAALGYARVGPRIREVLGTDLQTAVRRGVLKNDRGQYALLCRSMDEYELDHLVAMLTAAMGTAWQTRKRPPWPRRGIWGFDARERTSGRR